MGIIKQGILGGFSGKVGNVVGASWKGIDYIRSLPSSVRNPRTPGQVKQRTKFTLVQRFLTSMTPVVRVGFKNYAGKKTAFNAATSYNVLNGVVGEGDMMELDYPSLLISRGNLQPAPSGDALYVGGDIIVEWDNSVNGLNASGNDEAILVLHNSIKGESRYSIGLSDRLIGELREACPSHWQGDVVECYIAFVSEDGKDVSNSIHLASIEIPTE